MNFNLLFNNMKFFLLALSLYFSQSVAQADLLTTHNYLNLSLQSNISSEAFSVSGYSPGITAQKDITKKWTLGAAFEPLINFSGKEISRYSFGVLAKFAVFGQARRIAIEQTNFQFREHGGESVYLLTRFMHNNYQALIPETTQMFQGSNLEVQIGSGYRRDIFTDDAFGFEFLVVAASFFTAPEQVKSSGFQLTVYWLFGTKT